MCGLIANLIWCYFNPRSPHRERRVVIVNNFLRFLISIHAPLTGSDASEPNGVGPSNMSIHAPYVNIVLYFNPRSPHRERHVPAGYVKTFRAISIHAPLTGSDELGERPCPRYMEFQSTLPSQGATITELGYMDSLQNFNPRSPHRERRRLVARLNFRRFISIHAPLTGSDAGRQIYLTV